MKAEDYIYRNVYTSFTLGKNHCWYCGESIPIGSFRRTADHFWPKHLKGRLKVVCCYSCNNEKGGMIPTAWIEHLKYLKTKHHGFQPWQKKFDRSIIATESLWEQVKDTI